MNRKLISSGSEFEDKIGYSRAVVDGDYVFVSGTTGYNYDTMSISSDPVEQADQCFKNIEKALIRGGQQHRQHCQGALHLSRQSRFRALLAGVQEVSECRQACSDGVCSGPAG
jgi:enamine deaminase RidA (YjgF/YER057c/UK114 family)